MNRWQERFDSHPIHDTLKELHAFASKELDSVEENQVIEKRRFLKIIESFQTELKKLDPEIIHYQILDNINNQLRADPLYPQIQAYGTSGRAKHIRNANEHLNAIIPLFSSLYPQGSNLIEENPVSGLEKVFDSFVSTVTSEKERLKEQIQKLAEQASQQSAKITELTTDIDNRKKEINELIANWQKQFSDGQDQRQRDFSAVTKKHQDDTISWLAKITEETNKSISDAINAHNQKLTGSQSQFDLKVSAYLEEAKNKHQAILDLYQLTAGDSVAAAYIKSADDEKRAADHWRRSTIIFVIATAAWTAASYFLTTEPDLSDSILWFQIIKSLSITGVLLFGAIYSAKQSNAHRINERQTRWFALEVKAIDPFISSLTPAEQNTLKNKLSEKLFGQNNRAIDKDHLYEDQHYVETLLKGIADIIKAKK